MTIKLHPAAAIGALLASVILALVLNCLLLVVVVNEWLPLERSSDLSDRLDAQSDRQQRQSVAACKHALTNDTQQDELFVWSDEIRDWSLAPASCNSERHQTVAQQDDRALRCVWPEDQCQEQGDRLINQLRLKPPPPPSGANERAPGRALSVALANDFGLHEGLQAFSECNFNQCQITRNLYEARAIVFRDADVSALKRWPLLERNQTIRSNQIWIAHLLESPPNTFERRFERAHRNGRQAFNWTAAYRSDADLVTPYAKFVPYEHSIDEYVALKRAHSSHKLERLDSENSKSHQTTPRRRNAGGATKVAWFVSNCHARNGRLEFARELAKHVQVDVYGKCGNFSCAKRTQADCLRLLNSEYKFYLAFENSNQREYITEKLYRNALGYNDHQHQLVPIVLGAPRDDYERLAPAHSFIHVDDFPSAEALATRLKELDADEAQYSTYFKWKSLGRFIDTKFLCRVCALMHLSDAQGLARSRDNLRDWWLNDR